MKQNTLYELLEVSENASQEVIEKAYKVLAKRYHPDLQKEIDKNKSEEMMKKINEAYEILIDTEKRKKYDLELAKQREEEKQNISYNSNVQNQSYDSSRKDEEIKYKQKLRKEESKQRAKLEKEYEDAYYSYLKSLGIKVKHKWTKENIKDFFIVICIMAIIITALWFIPPTHNWMVNFYEQNPILKTIIDIIVAIITGIFTGIWNFITNIFS